MEIEKNYLIEEVRNGFMVPTAIKQYWAAILEVLFEIDRICEKHNIQYFADWGTLLGAVRHGGFVPWDDDLDIVMKREDYQKFLDVSKSEMKEGFMVQTYMEQEVGHWLFMGKVLSSNRADFSPEYMRKFHNFPFIASIDVFVLDYVYKDNDKEKERRELCLYLLALADEILENRLNSYQIKEVLSSIKKRWGLTIDYIPDSVCMGRYLYSMVEEQFAIVKEDEADFLCQMFPWGLKGCEKNYAKKLFETSIRIPFECTTIPVPLDFDRMLRDKYGDYFKFDISGGAHDYPCFQVQQDVFYNSIGEEQLKYRFQENEIHFRERKVVEKEQTLKGLLAECMANIGIPESTDEIIEYQQLAIELGNLIESVKGEGFVTVGYIEQYCECLYEIYEAVQTENEFSMESLMQALTHLTESVKRDILDKKTVVLMLSDMSHWNRLSVVYERLIHEDNTEVMVWPLERFYKDYDGRLKERVEESFVFHNGINVVSDRSLEKLTLLHPDIIVTTDGYDQWNVNISVNPIYYSENLIKCSEKLVYLCPYEMKDFSKKDERAYHNMDYYVLCPGVVRADEIWVGSEAIREAYINKLTEFSEEKFWEFWNSKIIITKATEGVECKDICKKNETSLKTILYCINIGSLATTVGDSIKTICCNLNTFTINKDLRVKVCFFPNITYEFSKIDEELYMRINSLIQEKEIVVEDYNRINYDEIDAFFGDGCSGIINLLESGKPVMFQRYK